MKKWVRLIDDNPAIEIDAEAIACGVLKIIGENPMREGLQETPERMVKAWAEMFSGYDEDPKAILKRFNNLEYDEDEEESSYIYDEMVVLRDIEFYSTCEHHFLPFFGKAHIAYIPGDHIAGISKLARLADCFARRLQIQERFTGQIADALMDGINAKGVGVIVEAKHLCMVMRGVKKQNSIMTTSALRGAIKTDPRARAEFISLIHNGKG